MHHDHRETQSMQALVAEALRETTDLARKEMALFRTEVSHNVKLLVTGLVAIIASAVFAIATLVLLTDAAVSWLAETLNSRPLAALIVAVVMFVIFLILVLYGRSKLSAATLEPTRTIRSVEQDKDVLANRRHA